jgi:hypothetical protein
MMAVGSIKPVAVAAVLDEVDAVSEVDSIIVDLGSGAAELDAA